MKTKWALPVMSKFPSWLARFSRLPSPLPRIALFIDGDGVSPKDAERAIDRTAQHGRVCILRAYGNYTGRAVSAWTSLIRRRGINARHMPNITPGKNGTDIQLSIDVIEMLLTRKIDTFALVVSDSDFVPLARRIKEEGKHVIGFGQGSTPHAFRKECDCFWEFSSLLPSPPTRAPAAPLWSLSPREAEVSVLAVLRDASIEGGGGSVSISRLGKILAERDPSFDTRVFSRRTLSDLLRDLPSVEIVEQDGERHVRLSKPPD